VLWWFTELNQKLQVWQLLVIIFIHHNHHHYAAYGLDSFPITMGVLEQNFKPDAQTCSRVPEWRVRVRVPNPRVRVRVFHPRVRVRVRVLQLQVRVRVFSPRPQVRNFKTVCLGQSNRTQSEYVLKITIHHHHHLRFNVRFSTLAQVGRFPRNKPFHWPSLSHLWADLV